MAQLPAAAPAVAPAVAAPALPPAAAPAVVPAADPVAIDRVTIGEGHLDLAARLIDGNLQLHIKDGTVAGTTTWREPSAVTLQVRPAAKREVPANSAFAFLGKPGDPVWILDQVQKPGLIWPGWSTENITPGAVSGDTSFKLTAVEGPGSFALFNFDAMDGAVVRFNSADGVPDAFAVPQNTHAHGGWAFSKPGTYRLTLEMSATLGTGQQVSDRETFTFAVGESAAPGAGAPVGTSAAPTTPTTPGTAANPQNQAPAERSPGGALAFTGGGDGLGLVTAAAVLLTATGAAALLLTRRRRRGAES